MFQYRWLVRRRAVALISILSILILSAFLASGCGLFGDDEPTPEVVEPPDSTAQTAESDTPTATVTSGSDQQDQPAEAVAVTTSPDNEQQQAQSQPAAQVETEEVDNTIYIVQPGDTLAEIANRLGVRIDDLTTLNGIQNPDVLQVGQELKIPSAEPTSTARDSQDEDQADEDQADDEQQEQSDDEDQIEPPNVELPTVAVPAATPTQVSYSQFPQPGPEQTTDTIPDVPSNFLQYGAAALPWLHGINQVDPIIELFKAWPMPALAVGHDRVVLLDTRADGEFSASIIYTDPNSFGAAVPFSNLVVYDPVPGDASKYRIAYDHALAYAREVQGIQQIADIDVTGDTVADLTFREITCDASGCVSSFYILVSSGDGYRTITGPAAQVAEVSAIRIDELTGDGVLDIVVDGLATDQATAERFTFVFTARGDDLVESVRISLDGESSPSDSDQDDGEDDTLE